ncbi:DUF1501 domain-containing protein [Fimbriimonas ginsengisoli]|uniref:Sulfatase n=1 Tax=Fimbriimonas ginsengisoli Gsoil 348 TaxID=661478 RepID=A0A068NLT9_FIMGI|nr:DUF1501 domain-containing protein [Fimbriimonas ginsengisoli]AIE84513.1 hypothetical protein OP10G_1145 [Fimbriimonas ginsengisoli Gsoil 348]
MHSLDPENPLRELLGLTRREFFGRTAQGFGAIALASLLPNLALGQQSAAPLGKFHHAPKAKRIIYLFQAGGPAQQDLFDYKPLLNQMHGQPLPPGIRRGQRLTAMSSNQSVIPLAGSPFKFAQHGESGAWFSEILPHLSGVADDLCFVKSMFTEAINHDPAITFFQTGSEQAGRPSFGSWLSYGLGSMNEDLPTFVVLASANQGDQPLYARLWGSGFLDSRYQGVRFRSGGDPVLYLSNPDGICGSGRRAMLDRLGELNRHEFERELDPEIESRIAQYEMAYRMQTSVPDVTDLSKETNETFELYGPESRKPGTFAANCLLARRLAQKGVRFIQLYHQGWDHHGGLKGEITSQCHKTDQPAAALIKDLKRLGMLDDTLVVWGGEFGRTSYSQGPLDINSFGRDHHPRCFTVFMAGGGVNAGTTYGRTDDYGYNIADADGKILDPNKQDFTDGAVHVHDLQATLLWLLGVDHAKLTFPYQGRDFRLTDVHGHVVKALMK